jgi:pilus assembly protein CpaF
MVTFLRAAVTARLNILISGGTGSGKTTMLNVLSAFIPESERIITIEDAAELQLQQTHVGRLETRPPNVEGKGEVVARDLVRNALRMRPDRIIVGEVRSVEILDMLQAMNTGHDGSMATVHANSPRDALARINAMIGMTGVTLSEDTTTQMVHRALDLIVQLSRGTDGRRRVVSIAEVTGAEGNRIQLQEIFAYRQTGVDRDGRVLGRFVASGVRPLVLERMERSGQSVPASLFTAGELS